LKGQRQRDTTDSQGRDQRPDVDTEIAESQHDERGPNPESNEESDRAERRRNRGVRLEFLPRPTSQPVVDDSVGPKRSLHQQTQHQDGRQKVVDVRPQREGERGRIERHQRHEHELGLFQELGDEIVDVCLGPAGNGLQSPEPDADHGLHQDDHHHEHPSGDEPILYRIIQEGVVQEIHIKTPEVC